MYNMQLKKKTEKTNTHAKLLDQYHAKSALFQNNYLEKMSKYDLDRMKIPFDKARRAKMEQRKSNVRAKKEVIEMSKSMKNLNGVLEKANKIREVNMQKEANLQDRKLSAIRHQDMLRAFIEEERIRK